MVDEGALPSGAAARLFGALVGVQKAGGFLQDVTRQNGSMTYWSSSCHLVIYHQAVDDVKVGAEELWVSTSTFSR